MVHTINNYLKNKYFPILIRPCLQPLYYAGLFLFLSNRIDKAREYIDRMLKLKPSSTEGLVLKGWIELNAGKDSKSRNIKQFFDSVLDR